MSTFQKSALLWLAGALVGAIGGVAFAKKPARPWVRGLLGGALGAIAVGSIGDATIERCQVGLWPCRR